jgi:hypothetical protein
MKSVGNATSVGQIRNVYHILIGKPQGKRSYKRSCRRWKVKVQVKYILNSNSPDRSCCRSPTSTSINVNSVASGDETCGWTGVISLLQDYFMYCVLRVSRDSAVGIATGYGLDD